MTLEDYRKRKEENNQIMYTEKAEQTQNRMTLEDYRIKKEEERKEKEEKKRQEQERKEEEVRKKQQEIKEKNKQEVLPTATYGPITNKDTLISAKDMNEKAKYKINVDFSDKATEPLKNGNVKSYNAYEAEQKIKNFANDTGKVFSNLGLDVQNAILQVPKMGLVAIDRTRNEQNKMLNDFLDKDIEYLNKLGKNESATRLASLKAQTDVDSTKGIQNLIDANNIKKQQNTEETSNKVSRKLAELAGGVGTTVTGGLISALNPALGTTFFTTSAAGGYYDEALERGMDKEDAQLYAGIMGIMEGATETVISKERIKGAKAILEGTGFKNAVKSFGLEVGENFLQEAVMPSISEITALSTGGKESLKYDFSTIQGAKELVNDSIQDGVDGALSAILIGGVTRGSAKCIQVITNINNGLKPSNIQIEQAVKEAKNMGVNTEDILKEELVYQAKKKIDNDTISNENVNNNNEYLENNILNNENTVPTVENNVLPTAKNEYNIENEKVGQLEDILNNKELSMQNYKYEDSNNTKINNLRKDASKYFNNSEKAHNYMQILEQIIKDKNIDIRLDENLKTPNGQMANGSYSNGVITINPKSTRTGEFIAIHELTHAIGTKDMIDIVNNYRKSNVEFDTAVQELLKNYNQTEITEEALADVSGQLFGNQEFINNLSEKNPNIFQKIYSEIKYLWHQFRGYRNQNQFIEDLYYKWTQAYKSNNMLNQTNNYYIETVEKFDESRYNNSKEIILPKREYAILSSIINSDSKIKAGINYVETTNARYTVYFKEIGEFKVIDKEINNYDNTKNDANSTRNIQRSETTGDERRRFSVSSPEVQDGRTGESDVELSTFNKKGTYKRIGSNFDSKRNSGSSVENSQTSFSHIDPTQGQYAKVENNKYSKQNENWQEYLDNNFKSTGTKTNLKDIKLPSSNENANYTNNYAPTAKNNILPVGENIRQYTMNPTEIANLRAIDASTTPQLEQKRYKTGNKQSSFLSNITTESKFLNEDLRQQMGKEDNIRYYQGITNEKTLEKAYNKLQEDGQSEVIKWHSKDSKNATAEDVAEGWILLKQYQDKGDYQSAVEVAKKMRDIGTTAGQTVQAYNILSRLTPEGMFYYAQSELNEAYNRMVEGKSKKWIEKNQSKFDLTPEETQSILDIMKDVSTMEDGYNKKVKLAEIQKIITDKIPSTPDQSIKAWMRISMLFNPKTQVRNVMGNAVILPVNMFSDSVSTGIDKLISKKTGVRTTGNVNLKNYSKGFRKGLYESYNDFKKGINTRNIEGNRFEVSEGNSFNNKGIGKALNGVDNLLSFMLDAGDRGFYEATFTNSINNQMILNKTTTPTQEMIDIATNEALQRTWQDNNRYTQSVLQIRNILNNVNVKGYGLGDVIIPFAKTPANLTKAIVDYSPAGLIKALTVDAKKFKNSLQNGQYNAQIQHQFVQNLGKATAGTFLYVLGYALAKAEIANGEADEDKDVKNFMKNSLGISSYSIKIGNKSFSYDWAQPVATPLAIMTNFVKYSKENQDANVLEKGINAINIGTEQLLQQSFMESLNTILNGNGTTVENLSQAVFDLPARAIPTFSKQIADMVDGTQRTSFEYNKPIQSAINAVIAKIPFATKSLTPSVDTLGNEIKKYGGNNNLWNVMFNPANMNKGQLSKAGQEIYSIYKETGDTTIFPRTAPYYINNKNEKITMTVEERNKFQTISGKYVENSLNALLSDANYKKLSNEEKANIINEIVSDSYSKAKYDVLKIDSKEYEKLRTILTDVKASSYYNYKFKTKDLKKNNEKIDVLVNSNYTNKEKTALYEQYILSSSDEKYPIIKETNINIDEYLKYKTQEFTSDEKDKVWNYIENMNITYTQKIILYGLEHTPTDKEQRTIINYVNSLPNKTNKEKLEILRHFKGFTIYKDGTVKY